MENDEDWKETGAWADDDNLTWDQETGAPTKLHFGNAIQVWALMQDRPIVTVAEAAEAFNVPAARIIEAIDDHSWMMVCGPDADYMKMTIEHDGD